ncbi:MAG: NfeD family protein [Gammaproteobacteria bacterium]|nr:NfeD family protein [Gammaproteobacteria bacterium]MDH5728829.1 NfeD family protein [Gammaproteobacteria bacterium]
MEHFELEFWHWWALALIFLVIEGVAPSGVFAALAVAGGLTGAAVLSFDSLSWQIQLVIFTTSTIVLQFIFSRLFKSFSKDQENVDTKAKQLLGEEFDLVLPIQNGFGEIQIDKVYWELKGPDMKKGTKVKVIGVDGQMLVVRAIKTANN